MGALGVTSIKMIRIFARIHLNMVLISEYESLSGISNSKAVFSEIHLLRR
jgi:hypothetical protein